MKKDNVLYDFILSNYSFGYIIALILWNYSFLEAKISIADFEVHLNISKKQTMLHTIQRLPASEPQEGLMIHGRTRKTSPAKEMELSVMPFIWPRP